MLLTAGELIRNALAGGATELGLAKRLAGTNSHGVQKWRFVVRRARQGAEPTGENAKHVAELFGVTIEQPQRQEVRKDLAARLEQVEALAVANQERSQELRDAVELVGTAVEELASGIQARLDQLERRLRALEQ